MRKIGQEIKRIPTNSWLAFFTQKKYSWITLYFKGGRDIYDDERDLVEKAEKHYQFIWPILNGIWFTRSKKEVFEFLRKTLREK